VLNSREITAIKRYGWLLAFFWLLAVAGSLFFNSLGPAVFWQMAAGHLAVGVIGLIGIWLGSWRLIRGARQRHELAGTLSRERALFLAGPTVIFQWQAEQGRPVAYVSENIEQQFGYLPADFSGGTSYLELVHPDDRSRVINHSEQFAQAGVNYFEQEYRLRDRKGNYRWVYELTMFVRADGRITGYYGYIQDISGRKDLERWLKQSEERLKLALYGADLGLWDWYVKSGEVTYNRRWAEMLGYRLEDLEPHYHTWKKLVHPDDLAGVLAVLEAHLQGETSYYESEHRLLHKDGRWLWVLDKGKVIERSDDGSPLRAVGTHLDISERKELEREQLDMARQLEQVERLKSLNVMAGAIAHHFNNIMMAVQGNLELLQMQLPDGSEEKSMASEAWQAAGRASQLSLSLLTYVGQKPLERKIMDVGSLVAGVVDNLRQEVGPNIVFNQQMAVEPCYCLVDAEHFSDVIRGLILNSSEAIGTELGEINISSGLVFSEMDDLPLPFREEKLVAGNYVFVEVRDNGCGMEEDVMARMFDPFFTTGFTGRGLGLAVAVGIVKSHGGAMMVSSKPGQGTTMRVLLPQKKKPAPQP